MSEQFISLTQIRPGDQLVNPGTGEAVQIEKRQTAIGHLVWLGTNKEYGRTWWCHKYLCLDGYRQLVRNGQVLGTIREYRSPWAK